MIKKVTIQIDVYVDVDINQHDEIIFTLDQDFVIIDVKDAIEDELYLDTNLISEYKQYCEESHAADVATQREFDKYHNTH